MSSVFFGIDLVSDKERLGGKHRQENGNNSTAGSVTSPLLSVADLSASAQKQMTEKMMRAEAADG